MSEGIKKYIMISATILLGIITFGICLLVKLVDWTFVILLSYLFGICNGLIIAGIENIDD